MKPVKLKENSLFRQKSFPCSSCGANLVFCADVDALKCTYCGAINKITPPALPIKENDLNSTLANIKTYNFTTEDPNREIKCPSCAASFSIDKYTRSTKCPYCNSPIVTNADIFMPLAPKSLLPFDINHDEAKEIFKKWVGNLWFAPNELKDIYDTDSKLKGIYLPYWTYDSKTHSTYRGRRGIVYHDRVRRRVYINGREEIVEDIVERIEWTPVSGEVYDSFDDVLIGATNTIPRKLADSLEPWDLENLQPYDERFLSGFDSEIYQVALDEGFEYAKDYMQYSIREHVRYQIGGDRQQITDLRVYHSDTTFKYILLPIWSAHFNYNNKEYRFAINARNGKIVGERPYSKLKIFIAVAMVLAILGAIFYFGDFENQGLDYNSPNIHISI
ncbi:MAG: primosomal protein N' (replication factor Y) - superfamily II helicase [Epsilonproteobacteria bacterium]|nr:primosomal protein N' (replication factor Y) - superfamily II helicase [Campylobacterota bacterium]